MNEPVPSRRASSRAQQRKAFFAAHPKCCFCHGEFGATEVDHVPARTCFRAKQGPENAEFPACSRCNRAAALSEQITALYIRFTENNSANFRDEEFRRLFWGVANNTPEALPSFDADTSRHIKSEAPAWPDKPGALVIPPAAHEHIELFATKVLYAIFYQVSGTFAGPRHRRFIAWAQAGTPAAAAARENSTKWFGDLNAGVRSNVDLGDQFQYRHGYSAAHGFLGLYMSFGQALVFFCVLGPSRQMATLKPKPKAIPTHLANRQWAPSTYGVTCPPLGSLWCEAPDQVRLSPCHPGLLILLKNSRPEFPIICFYATV